MTVIVACIGQRGGDGSTHVDNGTPRPLASLLRETNYASLTTKCLTVPGVCTVPNTSPRPSAFHDFSSVWFSHGNQVISNPCAYYI